jgi:hypothetical protein
MNTLNFRKLSLVIAVILLLLASLLACQPDKAGPVPTLTATATPGPAVTSTPTIILPTATPTGIPSATFTPTATSTVVPTEAPTATFTPMATPTEVPTETPTATEEPTLPASARYQPAFGINYAHPEKYLAQGEQSHISDLTALDSLRRGEQSMAHLGDIYRWLKREFTPYRAGGKTIGVVTVDELLAERRLGGCHDHGLVYAAVARELGYPALMTRTASIAWVKRFQAGEQGPHVGHVFVEVFLDGKWVLIDSTNGWYLEDGYDPADPVIPLKGRIAGSNDETFGFYVERKGIDTWAFGIHSPAESTQAMDALASQLNLRAIAYPQYAFKRFAK